MYIYHFFRDFSYSTYLIRKLHFYVVIQHLESLCYGNADTVDLYSPHFLIFGVQTRVSVQGVKSLGGHFACLYRGFEFCEVKKKFVIIF